MATVFETRLIGNIGKDAVLKKMDKGIIAINFPVAHNRKWRDKKTKERGTKTLWINCTIWRKEDSDMKIIDFLKTGTLVDLLGTPYPKAFLQENGKITTEIRLNVSKVNILRTNKNVTENHAKNQDEEENNNDLDDDYMDFTIDEDEF